MIETYDFLLEEFGCSATGVHWESERRQQERFALLAQLFDDEPFSVNDFGCGYGALFEYLSDRELNVTEYVGFDVTPAMVAAAQVRTIDPRARFVCAPSITAEADYTVASGVFSLPGENPRDRWHAWTFDALHDMWNHSRRGIGFNMLRADAEGMTDELVSGDPDEYSAWCRRNLSTNVELVMPEGWNDWALFVRRSPA